MDNDLLGSTEALPSFTLGGVGYRKIRVEGNGKEREKTKKKSGWRWVETNIWDDVSANGRKVCVCGGGVNKCLKKLGPGLGGVG